MIAVVIALIIISARHFDQQRWQRYQLERDMFFCQHPFHWQGLEQFELRLSINAKMQKKIINELMLKATENSHIRKVSIQREPEHEAQQYLIKVMLHDFTIGYLEPKYAEIFGETLSNTDFEVGRPIALNAEIIVFEKDDVEFGCHVKLDLPRDPRMAGECLVESVKPEHQN